MSKRHFSSFYIAACRHPNSGPRPVELILTTEQATKLTLPVLTMSDTEQDASVLGKRPRNGGEDLQSNGNGGVNPVEPIDEDDDEEIGPMPMPADSVIKKKRKGVSRLALRCCWASRYTGYRF
jgi:hypothetical protein